MRPGELVVSGAGPDVVEDYVRTLDPIAARTWDALSRRHQLRAVAGRPEDGATVEDGPSIGLSPLGWLAVGAAVLWVVTR